MFKIQGGYKMNREVTPGPITNGGNCIKEAVCIHTDKVYDSCRDKECLQDLRVYFTIPDQAIVDNATSVKITKAEVLWVYTEVFLYYSQISQYFVVFIDNYI